MFVSRLRRVGLNRSLTVAALSAATTGLVAVADPSIAKAALAAAATAVSCATSTACVSGNNTSSGPGVQGSSKTGSGVKGTSNQGAGVTGTSSSTTGMAAIMGTGNIIGIYGTTSTTSGSVAVQGYTPAVHGIGVEGSAPSSNGIGMFANGAGVGMYGHSTGGTASQGISSTGTGVYGFSGSGTGVVGTVNSGTGVHGTAAGGVGVQGNSSGGSAVAGFGSGSATALFGSSGSGYGLIAETSGSEAIYGSNTNGDGGDISGSYIGIIGRAPSSAYPLVLTDSNDNDVFYVDGSGNVSFHGSLQSFARTAGGATISSFSPKTTQPTVEDTGTAQLIGGTATIRLDSAFAASIDLHTPYRVFLTPGGDTHGLYVATKAAGGFIVRETEGGHSTLSFDYRIVATALGQAGRHMAVVNATTNGIEPRASAVLPPKQQPAANPAAPSVVTPGGRPDGS